MAQISQHWFAGSRTLLTELPCCLSANATTGFPSTDFHSNVVAICPGVCDLFLLVFPPCRLPLRAGLLPALRLLWLPSQRLLECATFVAVSLARGCWPHAACARAHPEKRLLAPSTPDSPPTLSLSPGCGTANTLSARDQVRCRACGYRIFYKVRTERGAWALIPPRRTVLTLCNRVCPLVAMPPTCSDAVRSTIERECRCGD